MIHKNMTTPPVLPSFQDTSTECAICLGPLVDNNNNDTNTNDQSQSEEQQVIVLKCGHRWHLECIQEQLQHAQPSHSRRILFTGCRCAKCGIFCDHESLQDYTNRTDLLRNKIDQLIQEQYIADTPAIWKSTSDKTKLLDEGRRMYAFYLCSCCNEPYFGGTVECADQEEGELASDERFCPSCSPHTSSINNNNVGTQCRSLLQHRAYHVWKCRYCCNPSNFLCYGTVHFCTECHDRNTKRYHNQSGARNTPLRAIPCRGGSDCSYPKLPNEHEHKNGSSASCEQVYFCGICSTKTSNSILPDGKSRSNNFVINPCGQQALQGWIQIGRSLSWIVEQPDLPVNDTINTCFVSSYDWCCMKQVIPIQQYFRNDNDNNNNPSGYSGVQIEVSALYMGRTDCPSVFVLEGQILDGQNRVVQQKRTGVLDAPVDYWERVSLTLDPTVVTAAGGTAHSVTIIVYGNDTRYWSGNFGSKVTDCSVRIIAETQEHLSNVLRETNTTEQQQAEDGRMIDEHNNNQAMNNTKMKYHLIWDVLAPIALLFLVWLIQDR